MICNISENQRAIAENISGVANERFSSSGTAHSSDSLASGTGQVVGDLGWLCILREVLDRQIAEP